MPPVPVHQTEAVLHRIREAAVMTRASTSLREVARDVGMSPSGLSKFLDGAQPYSRTFNKLRAWYVRRGGRRPDMPAADALAAIGMLLSDVPDERKTDCQRLLLECLQTVYADDQPGWLSELQAA